ncbi:Abi-alpha family protein [Clostridium coskatii]|jgi:hypothetical protein|uniref:DUF4393 domain-containing protein n=1 Tax=Clostridium coskatii TaxID=1705578 RepID=A0A166TD75_9CLOT|nr:Abi-alpha family protein [Clostridium coskatii]OAA93537.1 hypothetical protein WX73_04302 [Clostridium coskatii]OBR96326.1 hypothetical protein CLCOS_10390 [Clostridium coskatii]
MCNDTKVVEEVAKTAGKAIDLAQSFGSFISKFISGSVEQGMGIFEDKLKYMRWERQVRLMQKANEFMKEIGLDEPNKPIKLKFAIPLLQGATVEDNDYLQDLWAKLLVNSSNKNSNVELTRIYIDILERLTPYEAKILEKIYSIPFEYMQHKGVVTQYLPDSIQIAGENNDSNQINNDQLELALVDLARLGCIVPMHTLGGGEFFGVVNPTLLGKHFVLACTLKNN